MDFGTNISDLVSVAFPEEGTRAALAVPNVHDRNAREAQARLIATRMPERQRVEHSIIEARLSNVPGTTAKIEANSVPDSLLTFWTRIARSDMSIRMFGELVRIAAQPAGWRGRGSRGLRAASLRSFLDFWSAVRDDASEPELSLVPDGSLLAEWFKSERQRLDVRFVDHSVLFGLFANNRVLEGAEKRETVAQILKSHQLKPLTWSAR
jgi:hypothetical protein